jgi:hypothetical protein
MPADAESRAAAAAGAESPRVGENKRERDLHDLSGKLSPPLLAAKHMYDCFF